MKRMALQFVVRNMSSVVRSKDWKDCLMDHPQLMAEVGLSVYDWSNVNIDHTIQVMEAMARKESGEGFSKRSVAVGSFGGDNYKRPKPDGPVRN